MIGLAQKKYSYIIRDELGKEFKVSFDHKHQVDTWISMARLSDNKQYIIIKQLS